MKITPKIALEVAHHEAVVREAYKDSVGVWTWSVGLTNNSGHNVERYIGKPQTLEHCMDVYIWALQRYAKQVDDAFSGHKLTEEQFAAALSFHWNTGAIGRASWVRRWKAGDTFGARKAIMNWTKPKEIKPRRRAERDLFFSGKWSGDGRMTEYKVTSRKTPDWGSARKVEVRSIIERLLDAPPRVDHVPRAESTGGILAFIMGLFKK